MDGSAPKVTVDANGVKSLVRKISAVKETTISGLKAWSFDGVLNVSLEQAQDITIFNSTGMLVSNFKNTTSFQTSLNKGMYILRANGNSMKVMVQ